MSLYNCDHCGERWATHGTICNMGVQGSFAASPGYALTVTLREQGGWWTAICPELMVSGMGDDPQKAMEAVGRSIRSTLLTGDRQGHIGALNGRGTDA